MSKKLKAAVLTGMVFLAGAGFFFASKPVKAPTHVEKAQTQKQMKKAMVVTPSTTQERPEPSTTQSSQPAPVEQTSDSSQEIPQETKPSTQTSSTQVTQQPNSLAPASQEPVSTPSASTQTSVPAPKTGKVVGQTNQDGAPFVISYTNSDGVTRRSPVLFSSKEEAQAFADKVYADAVKVVIESKGQ